MKVSVIFRKYKNGEIIALFPDSGLRYDGGPMVDSYKLNGHCGFAKFYTVMDETVPATHNEYIQLKNELESIGYDLKIKEKSKVKFIL